MSSVSIQGRVGLNTRNWDRGVDRMQRDMRGLSGQAGRVRGALSTMANAGLAFNAVAGAMRAVGGAMAVPIQTAAAFEKQMRNTNTILQLSGGELDKLNKKLIDFSAETTSTASDVASAFYDIVSGVSDASKHMAILTAAENTATAGFSDLKATTNAMIGVMNAYNFSADKATHVSDLFTSSIANGVLTMDQLASSLPKVTGIAATSGVAFDELVASIAGLTKTGLSANRSATNIKAMITSLLNPTGDLKGVISELGYGSGEQLLREQGLGGAYQQLFEANGGTFAGLITNVEALSGASALMSEAAQETVAAFQDVTGATARAAAVAEDDPFQKFKVKLEALNTEIGLQVLPILKKLVGEGINPFIDHLREHLVPVISAFAGRVSDYLIPALQNFETEGLGGLARSFLNMIGVSERSAIAIAGLAVAAAAMIALSNPIAAAAVAVTAAVVAADRALTAKEEEVRESVKGYFLDTQDAQTFLDSSEQEQKKYVFERLRSELTRGLEHNGGVLPEAQGDWQARVWDEAAFDEAVKHANRMVKDESLKEMERLARENLAKLNADPEAYIKEAETAHTAMVDRLLGEEAGVASAQMEAASAQVEAAAELKAAATEQKAALKGTRTGATGYTVGTGDTLWDIAGEVLGDPRRWRELGYEGDPRGLQPGTALNWGKEAAAAQEAAAEETKKAAEEAKTAQVDAAAEQKSAAEELQTVVTDLQDAATEMKAAGVELKAAAVSLSGGAGISLSLGTARSDIIQALHRMATEVSLTDTGSISLSLSSARSRIVGALHEAAASLEVEPISLSLGNARARIIGALHGLITGTTFTDAERIEISLGAAETAIETKLASITFEAAAISVSLSGARARIVQALTGLVTSARFTGLDEIEISLDAPRSAAVSALNGFEVSIDPLAAYSVDMSALRARMVAAIDTFIAGIQVAPLPALAVTLSPIWWGAVAELGRFVSGITITPLDSLAVSLSSVKDRIVAALSAFVSGVAVNPLPALAIDLSSAWWGVVVELGRFVGGIDVPELSALTLGLGLVRARVVATLSRFVADITVAELVAISVDLSPARQRMISALPEVEVGAAVPIELSLDSIRTKVASSAAALVSGAQVASPPALAIELSAIRAKIVAAIQAAVTGAQVAGFTIGLSAPRTKVLSRLVDFVSGITVEEVAGYALSLEQVRADAIAKLEGLVVVDALDPITFSLADARARIIGALPSVSVTAVDDIVVEMNGVRGEMQAALPTIQVQAATPLIVGLSAIRGRIVSRLAALITSATVQAPAALAINAQPIGTKIETTVQSSITAAIANEPEFVFAPPIAEWSASMANQAGWNVQGAINEAIANSDFAYVPPIDLWTAMLTSRITGNVQSMIASVLIDFALFDSAEQETTISSNVTSMLNGIVGVVGSLESSLTGTSFSQEIPTWQADIMGEGESVLDTMVKLIKAALRAVVPDKITIPGTNIAIVSDIHEFLGISAQGGGSQKPRAGGGSVNAGELYRVNEFGNEYFRPNTGGEVIPVGGGGYTINIYANDRAGGEAAADAFEARFRELMWSVG